MLKLTAKLLIGTAALAGPALAWAQVVPPEQQNSSRPPQGEPIADTGLSDIIITATKTGNTKLQSTPLAISAFSSEQLTKTGTSNIRDLAQFTPNLNISQVTVNPVLTLRGIGTNNVFNGSDPDVTFQVDGVYYARPSAQSQDFLDIERIEILRGPQGTIYGRNAIGGTINVISRRPTETLTGQGVLTVGNYAAVQAQGFISGPIVPGKLLVNVSATYTRHDDYERNVFPGGQSGVYNANHGGVRGQVLWEPTDWLEATTRADYVFQHEHLPGPYHLQRIFAPATLATTIFGDLTRVSIDGRSTADYDAAGVSEDINIRFADNIHLRSITAYRYSNYELFTDNDGTELHNIQGHFIEGEHQRSQEFDINGKFGAFEAVVGAFFFDERAHTDVSAQVFGPSLKINSLPFFYARSIAGFGQGAYHLGGGVTLTAGIRYTTEKKRIDSTVIRSNINTGAVLPGFPLRILAEPTFDAFTPKFGIDWQATDHILLYATATKGYKSGGTNYAATVPGTFSFRPETVWSYEGGIKADLFDRRLRVNLNAFHYDYKDLQIQSSVTPGIVSINNAANATIDGIEAEITAKVTEALVLNGNISGLRAKYGSFTQSAVAAQLGPLLVGNPRYNAALGIYDASGNTLNQAPQYSGTVAANYTFKLANDATITPRADVYFQGRVFYDPQNSVYTSQPPYALVNAQIGFESKDRSWQLALFSKNLLNKHYFFAFQANGVAPAGFAAAPRTYGLRVAKSF